VSQTVAPKPRLLETYRTEIVPAMMGEFEFKSVMEVPRLQKIVLNIGLGEALTNSRAMESATRDLSTISGQKAIITRVQDSGGQPHRRVRNPAGRAHVPLPGPAD
jgi:large subunit ribosomal protein L5